MAGLQDQFKTRSGPLTEKELKGATRDNRPRSGTFDFHNPGGTRPKSVASSNGNDVGRKFDGRLINNQTDLTNGTEPETVGTNPFFNKDNTPDDLSGSVNNTSALDPAGTFDPSGKKAFGAQKESAIRPNPLNNYSSYTYNIKLGLMTPQMLNEFSEGNYASLNNNLLISSGGMDSSQRAEGFEVDFYIDNLSIQSIIGLNQMTGGANATEITFTITEPNGVTFFNRLLKLCRSTGIKNYLDVPYFLKVQFQGYKDTDDNEPDQSLVPFITPIKITGINNRVTVEGGVYDVEAVAFYDSALFSTECSIHETFSGKAATVGEFFDKLTEFYNNYYKNALISQSKGNTQTDISEEYYHTIKFEIDEEIRNSPIKFNLDVKDADKTAMSDAAKSGSGFQATAAKAMTDRKLKLHLTDINLNFPSGSNIIKIINQVIIQQSNYIKSQKIEPEERKRLENISDKDKRKEALEELSAKYQDTLKWFKIKNKKLIKQFNIDTQKYSRTNTFVISKYEITNKTVPTYPGWGETKPVKNYKYIYTGENDSVLDFNIKFDALYYQAMIPNPDQYRIASGKPDDSGDPRTKHSKQNADDNDTSGGIAPAQQNAVPPSIESGQGSDKADYQQQDDRILQENLYTNAKGDMVELDLKIIGDPDFLVGYNEADFAGENMNLLSKADEINCNVLFKTPQDYDDDTGLLVDENDPFFVNSAFSGVYKIIMVQSSFSNGQFIQDLNMVRLFNQPGVGVETKKEVTKTADNVVQGVNGVFPGSGVSNSTETKTGLETNESTASVSDTPPANTTRTGLGTAANVSQSNGSTVFAGLGSVPPADGPATVSTQPGQTSLTNSQAHRVSNGGPTINDQFRTRGRGKDAANKSTGRSAAETARNNPLAR